MAAGPMTAQVDLDAVRAGRFDYGKMWTFEYAPQAYFTDTYGFQADDAWFERARLAALRIPGCSASFVSAYGLMATNHHCVRGRVAAVSGPGEMLLDSGFYATSLEDERRIPGYYADQLIAVEDVSDEIFAAMDMTATDTERDAARDGAIAGIQGRLRIRHADLGDQVRVQVIPLYNGGRYSAYVFRRFSDIRLVFAAELQMGFFGGDPDNFTYPRYDLDFAFIRVYDDDGEPYRPTHYFGWSQDGVEEGDVVFVIGNPGPTRRLHTIAQLEFQRDVSVPARVAFLASRLAALREFYAADPELGEQLNIRNRAFSLSNSLKAYTGRLAALCDPAIMARKADAEHKLREAMRGEPGLQSRFGGVLDQIASLQTEKANMATAWAAFDIMGSPAFSAATIRRAITAYAYMQAEREGAPADRLAAIRNQLLQIDDISPWLEHRLLTERLADLGRAFGTDSRVGQVALRGMSAEEAARQLLQGSVLGSAARTAQAMNAGSLPADDPGVEMAATVMPHFVEFASERDRLDASEQEFASQLGRARFAVYGQDVPPDASSSPRITDGVVMRYEYNGTVAASYATFFGMYDRHFSHGVGSEWDLPYRWRTPPVGLDLGTPLNFISTADTYGGNSGSPAVTPDLALVGLNFDRNIDGLSRDFIYLPARGRNVMVDVRAMQAALDHVYDADRIVVELNSGRLFRTEAEADANR
jgi:hypothetical protein